MTFKRKVLLALVVAVVATLAFATNASAFNTFNGHVLNGGVASRYYYITYSASDHSGDINNAVYTWIHTTSRIGVTTPIYWIRTTTQSASVMDFYHNVYYDDASGIIAVTEQILNNQVINPNGYNWNWGKIKLNTPCYDPLSSFNEEGSCAHEIGHLMGLNHTSTTNRVMCTYDNGRTVNAAQVDDANGINYLY